jgi:hypothetical protein
MRKKRLLPIALCLLTVAAVVAPTAAGLPKIPGIPKGAEPVKYPVTIETGGYVTYTWTYDNRSECTPGYAKTVTEKFTFSSNGPRRAQMAVVYGKAFSTAPRGGNSELSVKLTDWQETNYCKGTKAKIKKATCHDVDGGPIVFAVAPESENGEDALTPLVKNTNFVVARTKGKPMDPGCWEERPDIETENEYEKDWSVDPRGGISVPLGANSNYFRNKLDVGDTLRQHINIGGNCEKGTAKVSALPTNITGCDLDGHVDVVIRRPGR